MVDFYYGLKISEKDLHQWPVCKKAYVKSLLNIIIQLLVSDTQSVYASPLFSWSRSKSTHSCVVLASQLFSKWHVNKTCVCPLHLGHAVVTIWHYRTYRHKLEAHITLNVFYIYTGWVQKLHRLLIWLDMAGLSWNPLFSIYWEKLPDLFRKKWGSIYSKGRTLEKIIVIVYKQSTR